MPYGRDKPKDTYMKREPVKNLGKTGAKAKEKSQARMTRQEESGSKKPPVVAATMVDKKNADTFQVGRDAKTGRFIPVKEANRRRKTAVVETITKKK
jgi:hypothetical protein